MVTNGSKICSRWRGDDSCTIVGKSNGDITGIIPATHQTLVDRFLEQKRGAMNRVLGRTSTARGNGGEIPLIHIEELPQSALPWPLIKNKRFISIF